MSKGTADYTIIFDGGSLGNPGRGYGSYALHGAGDTEQSVTRLQFPGIATSNEAEYDTLLAALQDVLQRVHRAGGNAAQTTVDVRGDSLLVISQVMGAWKAREPRMAERRDRVRALARQFKQVTFAQHPRSQSVRALGH